MKNIALMTAVTLGSFAAISAEPTPTSTPADCPATPACQQNGNGTQCGDTCWVDMETITVLAENGDPIAQYAIAWITDNGMNDTPADPEKAADMYSKALPGLEKAAREGNPTACCALAHMYATGKGVAKDPEKAREIMKWCKECCKDKKVDKAAEAAPAEAAPANADSATEM